MNYLTLNQILHVIQILFDIIIVWILIYYIIKIVRSNSRTTQIFKGLVFVLIIQALANFLGLTTLAYLTDNIMTWGFLAIIIIFQPEIRSLLERFGKSNLFSRMSTLSGTEKEQLVQALMDATSNLAESKTGALITLEQSNSLSDYIKTGVRMNSIVTAELLCSIFATTTPLHDGAVIIQGDKLSCASAYFPPTNLDLPSRYGARHRAAIGISEMTDAITIIVSEETGRVAIAEQGKLIQMNERRLREYLNRLILGKDTVTTETVTPTSSESVSIENLFKKEKEEIIKQELTNESKTTDGETKSVVIIDENDERMDEDFKEKPKTQMKTFIKSDFKANLDDEETELPMKKKIINKSEDELKDEVKKEIHEMLDINKKEEVKKKESKPLFGFLHKEKKKTAVESIVREVAKEDTQQIRLKELKAAEKEANELENKRKLDEVKEVVVPPVSATQKINKVSDNTGNLPPVKPLEITRVGRTQGLNLKDKETVKNDENKGGDR